MDCCGGSLTRRHWIRNALLGSAGALLGGGAGTITWTPEVAAAAAASTTAVQVLKDHISVDVHSHAGPTGIIARTPPTDDLAKGMRAGRLATVCLADVPDGPLLGRDAAGMLAAVRQAAPGQLYRYHLDRLAWMDELVAKRGVR